MPSLFAQIVLYCWPLVVFFLFKRLPRQEALIWSVVAGYLLVPSIVGFDLPLVPAYNKELVINLSAAVMCIAVGAAATRNTKAAVRSAPIAEIPNAENTFVVQRGQVFFWSLVVLLFSATLITIFNNNAPSVRGTSILPGLRPYDALAINMGLLIKITPFLLARRYLASPEAHVALLKIFVLACLAYSLLALWELRMSPQLNKQIYGFSPNKWTQNVRGDGFRPIVFMHHGLWLAIILAMSSLAALALWREKLRSSDAGKWLLAGLYLFVVVFLINSLGAFIIAALLLPAFFLFGVSLQLFFAAILSGTVLFYPMLRGADLIPTQAIHDAVLSVDAKRAQSLLFRFDNEDELLAHANKKPVAGWGTWGRNRVINEKGKDVAATDGYWIIVVGVFGWLGYIAQFGLLGIASILLALNRRRLQLTAATSGLAIVTSAALVDLLLNATISPVVWLFAGALMGRYQTATAVVRNKNLRETSTTQSVSETDQDTPIVSVRAGPDDQNRPLHQRRPREG